MHQVDERVPIADLRALTTIYRKIIDGYFGCSAVAPGKRSIIHLHQIQPVRRRHRAAGCAVARGERFAEIIALHLPSPTATSEPTIERT